MKKSLSIFKISVLQLMKEQGFTENDICDFGIAKKTKRHTTRRGWSMGDGENGYLVDFIGYAIYDNKIHWPEEEVPQMMQEVDMVSENDKDFPEKENANGYTLFYVIIPNSVECDLREIDKKYDCVAEVGYDEPGGTDDGNIFFYKR